MESKATAPMHDTLQWLVSCSPRAGNNFYGRVLNGCGKMPVADLKTCAVSLTPQGHYRFVWDPIWYEEQTQAMRILVVIHEVGHLVLKHCERALRMRLALGDQKKFDELHDIINIAMDMAANDTIVGPYAKDSPNSAAYKKELEHLVFPALKKYPSGETFEEYLARLLDELEKQDKWSPGCRKGLPGWVKDLAGMAPGAGIDPVMNIPMNELTDAEMERIISTAGSESRQLIKDAIEQTKRSRGTIPHHLESILEELIAEPKAPWHQIFRGYLKTALSSKLAEPKAPWHQIFRGYLKTALSSKLAESSAYPNPALFHLVEDEGIEPYTGYQKEFTFNMAILIDSSGSISRDDYAQFMGEIQGIAKAEPGATALLVYFDAAIQKVEMLTLAPDTLDHPYRYSHGGTDFRPPFQYILGIDARCDASMEETAPIRKRWDVVVMLTDGEAPIESPGGPCPDLLPPCPVIWALVGRGQPHPAMGSRTIKIGD